MKCPRCQQEYDEGPPGLEGDCSCRKPFPIPEPPAATESEDELALDERCYQAGLRDGRAAAQAEVSRLRMAAKEGLHALTDGDQYDKAQAVRSLDAAIRASASPEAGGEK